MIGWQNIRIPIGLRHPRRLSATPFVFLRSRKRTMPSPPKQCISIKSKKHPDVQCPTPTTRGEFCARHAKAKNHVRWAGAGASGPRTGHPLTRRQKNACELLRRSLLPRLRAHLRRQKGPATYALAASHNDRDIYSFESLATIPTPYLFSYTDTQGHTWTFDIRFLVQLLQYGKEIKNPFSQAAFPTAVMDRFQRRTETLRRLRFPIVYTETDTLTPEQAWNQKVLDVFLKLTSLGFGINVLWFETLTVRGHETFYRRLWTQWNLVQNLTEADRERLVPGHANGRAPLFRWDPEQVEFRGFDVKWWRKQNLGLMNAFLSRGQDRETLGCGALYILTALAQTHPRAAEAFPWLVGEDA